MPRIFVVDDDELILKSLSRMLRRPGFEIVPFPSPEQALEQLAHPPDLIICDYHLPRIDGLDVVAAAKAADPRTKTVLLTGGFEDERIGDALSSRTLDRFLPKPWHYEELLALVDDLLGRDGG